MIEAECDQAWAEKQRLDDERREYEEHVAWLAWRLFKRGLLILFFVTLAVILLGLLGLV